MTRKRRSSTRKKPYSYAKRVYKRAKGIIPFVSTYKKATSIIKAVKKRKEQKLLGQKIRSRTPNIYRRLPKCATQRERLRRAFFGYLKTQMPLARVGSGIRNLKQKSNNHRFDMKPCRR